MEELSMKALIPRTNVTRRERGTARPKSNATGLTGDRAVPRGRGTSTSEARKEFSSDTCAVSRSDRIGKASRWRVGKSDVHTMPVVYRTKRDRGRGGRKRRRREGRKERGRERTEPPRKSCGGVPADGPGPTRSIYPFFESAFSLRLSIFLFLYPSLGHSLSPFHPFHSISRSHSRTSPHPRNERESPTTRLPDCPSAHPFLFEKDDQPNTAEGKRERRQDKIEE